MTDMPKPSSAGRRISALPIVAILYDFDKTLCTKNMQEYGFIQSVEMSGSEFWKESNMLTKTNKMDSILAYMYMMLDKSKSKKRATLRKSFTTLGKDLEYFPGVEKWFDRINTYAKSRGLTIEHYIISSGLKEIINGTSIKKNFKEIYACEFYYDENEVACWPKNVVNYTTKTQFVFRINKGILDISKDEELNTYTPDEERRIPFKNMIFIGDGLTDVPCMKLVKVNGGSSIVVYSGKGKAAAQTLLADERVDYVSPADYTDGGHLDKIVKLIIDKIAATESLKKLASLKRMPNKNQTIKPAEPID